MDKVPKRKLTASEKLDAKRARSREFMRKKLANRTAEDRERFNLEQRLKYKGKKKKPQTDENRQKNAEWQRLYRAKKKAENAILSCEDSEKTRLAREKAAAKRRLRNERDKKRMDDLKNNDPERYREHLDKARFRRLKLKTEMTEEQKKAVKIRDWMSTQALMATLTPEEVEKRRKKAVEWSISSQKKRWQNATEEEKQQRRIYLRITERKRLLRKKLFEEGLSTEEVRKRADAQAEIWWKEVYPEGKPKRKKGIRSRQVWMPSNTPNKGDEEIKTEVVAFKFVCVKCYPNWNRQTRSWSPVGFNRKSDLVLHVKEEHPSSFFLCSNCNLLKYSKRALETHSQYCIKKIKS